MKNVFLFIFLLPLFFICQNRAKAQGDLITINEVCWMGTTISANDEWLELKNLSADSIDLSGWILEAEDGSPKIQLSGSVSPGGFFLLERTDDNSASGVGADQIYSGSLGNEGEKLFLKDASGTIIHSVDASGKWPAGNNESKKTMERNSSGLWQNSATVGGTPGAENSSGSAPVIEENKNSNQNETVSPPANDDAEEEEPTEQIATSSAYFLGDALINEFVSDPADGEIEWVELFNNANKIINLNGWVIEEGSGTKTLLSGTIGLLEAERFLVIEKINGNLSNSGDIIKLKDPKRNLIDQVAYGSWDDGDKNNNAPSAGDPSSTARKIDGFNSFNNKNDFVVTTKPTKKTSNVIESAEKSDQANLDLSKYDFSEDIYLTEIYPNPKKGEEEFVEIFNAGQKDINLFGWILRDAGNGKYQFPDMSESRIKAGGYLVLPKAKSKITLNNDIDSVKLYQPGASTALRVVKYDKTSVGQSFSVGYQEFKPGGDWQWTEKVTPGKMNIISIPNREPIIALGLPEKIIAGQTVAFDASDSYDDDGDVLKYKWEFGDGVSSFLESPEHVYAKPGKYLLKFCLSDGLVEAKKEKALMVYESAEDVSEVVVGEPAEAVGEEVEESSVKIIINEIFPNPETGGEEWVELKNIGTEDVDLKGFILDDVEGGSKAYEFKESKIISVGGFQEVKKSESKIAFNNSNESVRLFSSSGSLLDERSYAKSYKGQSYARSESGSWNWSKQITPGAENQIPNSQFLIPNNNLAIKSTKSFSGSQVIRGVVLVKPGVMGSQYFYIASGDNSFGYQVYSYKKDFPKLEIGDLIEVVGDIGVVSGEPRIKISSQANIKILNDNEVIIPRQINSAELSEDDIGSLVEISGAITEKKGQAFYLDDGEGEVYAYAKKGAQINLGAFKEGENIKLIGIVGASNGELRLLPRSSDDLITDSQGEVLGEKMSTDWQLPARERRLDVIKYLFIFLGGIIIAGALWLIKKIMQ